MQSTVVQATHIPTNKTCIAKVTKFDNHQQTNRFANECDILTKLSSCKHIVKMIDSFVRDNKGVLILERYPFDLMTLIEANQMSLKRKMALFLQLCKAVKECHKHGVAHLDLKPENILVSADFTRMKLCDFGNSKILPEDGLVKICSGTLVYSPPEYFDDTYFDGKKADIWALGILYHVFISDTWPYTAKTQKETLYQLTNGMISMHSSLTESQRSVMMKMTQMDPANRINISEVCTLIAKENQSHYLSKVIKKLNL